MALFNGLDRGQNLSDLDSASAGVTNLGITATAAEINQSVAGLSATSAELDLLSTAGIANANASKALILDANKRTVSTATTGTVGTGVTAVEYSPDGLNFTTMLTLTALAITIGDTAALAGGNLIYTFPAGAIVVRGATISYGITLTTGTPTTDTPDVGLGTVIGSGANATLDAVGSTSEDIMTGQTAGDVAGTATLATVGTVLAIEAAGTKTVHINWADTWANVDNTAATGAGTIVLNWSHLPLA